jgi:hypothetical protein
MVLLRPRCRSRPQHPAKPGRRPHEGGHSGVSGTPRRSSFRCPSHNPEPCKGWLQPGKEQGLIQPVYRAFSVGENWSSVSPTTARP